MAGLAASIHEQSPTLRSWPEVMFTGLLVGAHDNIDAASGGVEPLNLHDAVDDRDGAGMVDGKASADVLAPSAGRNGGDPASALGHDYGTIQGLGRYPEVWRARVEAGETLRVASNVFAQPGCTMAYPWPRCSRTQVVKNALVVRDRSTGAIVGLSLLQGQTYQYVGWRNTGSAAVEVDIELYAVSWPTGLPWSTFGVSWRAN